MVSQITFAKNFEVAYFPTYKVRTTVLHTARHACATSQTIRILNHMLTARRRS